MRDIMESNHTAADWSPMAIKTLCKKFQPTESKAFGNLTWERESVIDFFDMKKWPLEKLLTYQ